MKYVVRANVKQGAGVIVCHNDNELVEAVKQGLTMFGTPSLTIERFNEQHVCDDDCPEHGWRAP